MPRHILPPAIMLLLACGTFEWTATLFNKWLGGKIFKRRLLSRNIAPKRTWEGLLGATVALSAVAIAAAFYYRPGLWFTPETPDWSAWLIAIVKFTLFFLLSIPAFIFGLGVLSHFGALAAIYLRQTTGITQPGNGAITTLLGSLGLPLAISAIPPAAFALLDLLPT